MPTKKTFSLLLALVGALILAAPAAASTSFTVNDSGDAPDALAGDGFCLTAGAVCTLRAAIDEADAQAGPGPFTVTFNLPAGATIATAGGLTGTAGKQFVTSSPDGTEPNAITSTVGQATADGAGAWSLTYGNPLPDGTRVTAAQTLPDGSSGELTQVKTVVDATPPETTIDDGPSGAIAYATPSWAFSSEPSATFECRVDGDSFAPCSSPYTPTALLDGDHTFEVRARDNSPAQNADPTPASRTVTVDTTAPDTSISGPAGPTSDATPTFGFASDDPGAGFECRVDGGAFVPCATTFTTAALADGAHTLEARSVDGVGNVDATPTSRALVVDTKGPAVVVGGGNRRASTKGVVSVPVVCPATELTGPCTGRLTLRSGSRLRVGTTRRIVTLATVKVSVPRGTKRTVKITLSKTNRGLLARLRTIKASATLPAKDALGNARTAKSSPTLLAPKR